MHSKDAIDDRQIGDKQSHQEAQRQLDLTDKDTDQKTKQTDQEALSPPTQASILSDIYYVSWAFSGQVIGNPDVWQE